MKDNSALKAKIGVVDIHDGRASIHARSGRKRRVFRMLREGRGREEIAAELRDFFGAETKNAGLSGLPVVISEDGSRLGFHGNVLTPDKASPVEMEALKAEAERLKKADARARADAKAEKEAAAKADAEAKAKADAEAKAEKETAEALAKAASAVKEKPKPKSKPKAKPKGKAKLKGKPKPKA